MSTFKCLQAALAYSTSTGSLRYLHFHRRVLAICKIPSAGACDFPLLPNLDSISLGGTKFRVVSFLPVLQNPNAPAVISAVHVLCGCIGVGLADPRTSTFHSEVERFASLTTSVCFLFDSKSDFRLCRETAVIDRCLPPRLRPPHLPSGALTSLDLYVESIIRTPDNIILSPVEVLFLLYVSFSEVPPATKVARANGCCH